MNKAILIGRLGKDPESRFTQTNTQVVNFSIATSKKVKGEEQTEWHNIVTFAKTAEIAERYLKKGDLVCIEGSIQTNKYEKDGQTRYSTQIVCDRLEMLGGDSGGDKGGDSVATRGATATRKTTSKVEAIDLENIDDDLPFAFTLTVGLTFLFSLPF